MTHRDPLSALPAGTAMPAGAGWRVRAPSRLHMGFLDPAATLGRRFGSLGLVIDGFDTVLDLAPAAADQLDADTAEAQALLPRLAQALSQLRARTGCTQPLALRLQAVPPAHAGFGSGTQLALALGRAFALVHGLQCATPELAAWLGRGLRSGIGIAGFDGGGLLLDGGPAADGRPAAPLARITLPPAWRVLLVLDPRVRGLSGDAERAALAQLVPLPREAAADLCHHVLMAVLPGAAQADFAAFARGVNRLQQVLGAHFAPAQQGRAFTSAAVGQLLDWVAGLAGDAAAVGQSSWGPTGFAVLPSAAAADALVSTAQAAGVCDAGLVLRIVSPRAQGASLQPLGLPGRPAAA